MTTLRDFIRTYTLNVVDAGQDINDQEILREHLVELEEALIEDIKALFGRILL